MNSKKRFRSDTAKTVIHDLRQPNINKPKVTYAMKIEIKNLKVMARLSKETDCFAATIYIDGVKAFTAENNGNGGCNNYYPVGGNRKLLDAAEAYAKNLPPQNFEGMVLESDLDLVIGDLVADLQTRKILRTLFAKNVVFAEDGEVRAVKTAKANQPAQIARLKIKYPAAKILNELPEEDAVAIYNTVN